MFPKPNIFMNKSQNQTFMNKNYNLRWEKNQESMGFYLYRLERKQIDGILSLQIEKKQIQRQNNL
jgi:hypothetical protein